VSTASFADVADVAATAHECCDRHRKPAEVVMPAQRADFGRRTGATGVEPATSGVTGRSGQRNVDDVRCGIALSM
jgi:hypothetical protein